MSIGRLMVVLDATFLLLFLRPDAAPPNDQSGHPISHGAERVAYLIRQLDESKAKVVIPTPALSEALVRPGIEAAEKYVERLQKMSVFRIYPFDTKAAMEVAAMARAELVMGRKRGNSDAPWQKVKYDRQIVAIAKVVRASTIYSDDRHVRTIARKAGIEVVRLADLPLPPHAAQRDLGL